MLAVVWHFWISVVLVLAAIGLVVGTIVAYLRKVVMPRYPRR